MHLWTFLNVKMKLNHVCVCMCVKDCCCGETRSAIQSLSDGLGCDKLPAHMVLSLSHLALVCLSLQAQTPSAQPSHIPTLSLSL